MHFDQAEYDLRCEWGLEGLLALRESCDAIVIVDVLSFSTAVDIALGCGASVLPYRWKDESAVAFAAERGAVLAAGRGSGGYSLSPASLRAIPAGALLVLPSPNGATLAVSAGAAAVYTACLRNAPAVAQRAARHGRRIAVIPAGEQWRDASLRPCVEDLVGAGAVLAEMPGSLSPEAGLAVAAFAKVRDDLGAALLHCSSGKELVAIGSSTDVELAAEYATSRVVPRLMGDRFVGACP